ncbi:hypothetical protein [Dysgonomonas termitidis]|uniref:Uncharacterized protein n=1 Tax=Dysgonomonas termitidis TaxID=1516126 RepID=A0ABV9KUC9_9BACT
MSENDERKNYLNATMYEIFICRAFKCNNSKNGAHLSNMKNLIDAENGKLWVSHLPSASAQLITVKKYISNAIDEFLKKRLSNAERENLLKLKHIVELATSSSQLFQVIDEGLEITDRFK